MQRSNPTEQAATTPVEPTVQPQGPKPIDPADFKFIAGGAPRNGWLSSAPTETDLAPRNGW